MAVAAIGILKQLFAVYPNSQSTEQTVAVYLRLLQDIPPEELQTIVDQCIAQNKFLPTIAELRDMHHTLTLSLMQPTAAEAWGEVRKAITSTGHIRIPQFDDPLVERAVAVMGWRELCISENQIADRARFLQIYGQLEQRKTQNEKLLPPARQLAEQNGYKRQLTAVRDLLPDIAGN